MSFRRLLVALVGLFAAIPAHAAWLEASSRHFVIYADTKPDDIAREATQLETLDYILRMYHGVSDPAEVQANRLTVYMTPDTAALQRLYGTNARGIGGFYIPRADGAVAYTPLRAGSGSTYDLSPRAVLFHEYAHHFLQANNSFAYPGWFSEGYAEYVGSMGTTGDYVAIGRFAAQRAFGMVLNDGLTIRQLFDPPAKLNSTQRESIYSRGFLLTHYLMSDPARRKQLNDYLIRFNQGAPPVDVANEVFDGLGNLDQRLDAYMRLKKWATVAIPRSKLPKFDIAVRSLGAGQAALMSFRMASDRGVNDQSGPALYARAAPVAAQFPADAIAQGWFAEIAYDAGQYDAADAAADRALATDAQNAQAMLYKARVVLRRAELAKTPPGAKAWKDARAWILRANRLSTDDADALSLFYFSFARAGETPTKNAVTALQRAFVLVPQDNSLRFAVVRQAIIDNDRAIAKTTLRPLTYSPHVARGGRLTVLQAALDADQPTDKLLAIIDAKQDDGG